MTTPSPSDAFARRECGCPVKSGRFPYKCPQHAALDGRAALPWGNQDTPGWYQDNCCPFCGRVNAYGLACNYSEACALCGVRSCRSHGQAVYMLKVICPRDVNPRTKVGRALLKSFAMMGGAK
jgi:hypothetical protein